MKMSEVLVFILRVGTNFLYCSSPIQRRATFEGDAQAAGDKAWYFSTEIFRPLGRFCPSFPCRPLVHFLLFLSSVTTKAFFLLKNPLFHEHTKKPVFKQEIYENTDFQYFKWWWTKTMWNFQCKVLSEPPEKKLYYTCSLGNDSLNVQKVASTERSVPMACVNKNLCQVGWKRNGRHTQFCCQPPLITHCNHWGLKLNCLKLSGKI